MNSAYQSRCDCFSSDTLRLEDVEGRLDLGRDDDLGVEHLARSSSSSLSAGSA